MFTEELTPTEELTAQFPPGQSVRRGRDERGIVNGTIVVRGHLAVYVTWLTRTAAEGRPARELVVASELRPVTR